MSAPSPCNVTQTPQREFASAKVQQNFDICKFIYKKGEISSKRYPGTPESRHPDANLAGHRQALNQKEKGMPEPQHKHKKMHDPHKIAG